MCPDLPGESETMRDLFSETLPVLDAPPPPRDEKRPEKLSREFVRWCCSFGADFRNSPDINNLRFWLQKTKLKLKEKEESEILDSARPAFLKQIEQQIRKTEVAN
jgi:hypothetical protein